MQLGLTRRNAGRLVLLLWAVALAWLARRQFSDQGAAGTAERARRLEPGAQYFAVRAGPAGRQIGQLNIMVDTLVDGVRVATTLVLDLPLGDSTRQLALGSDYTLTRALHLRQFSRTRFGLGPSERLSGTLRPDSVLELTDGEAELNVAGRWNGRIDPDAILTALLPYRAAFGGHLHAGDSFTVPLFEPGRARTRPLQVRVTAESTFIVPDSARYDSVAAAWVPATLDTVRAWRLEHDAPGAPTVSWVDRGGALLRQETAGGLTLERTAFEIVRNNYRRRDRAGSSAWRRDIPGMLPLLASGLIPDTTAALRLFLVTADSGRPGPPGGLLDGGRQLLRADTLLVRRETPADSSAATQPAWRGPAWDLAVSGALRQTAQRLLRGAITPADSARALTRFVAREILSDSSANGFTTALNTYQARRGSAVGKARLLASLARAVGIPARVAGGIAVLPAGRFLHSWTELWLGRWVAADPSYGHFPASASLVRLTVGEGGQPTDLLPLTASARFLPIPPVR